MVKTSLYINVDIQPANDVIKLFSCTTCVGSGGEAGVGGEGGRGRQSCLERQHPNIIVFSIDLTSA